MEINKDNWVEFILNKETLQRRRWLLEGLSLESLNKLRDSIKVSLELKKEKIEKIKTSTDQVNAQILKDLKQL